MPKITKLSYLRTSLVLILWMLSIHAVTAPQQDVAESIASASLVTLELIEARIAAVESADSGEGENDRLLKLLRDTQSNLQKVRSSFERATTYRAAGISAPEQALIIRNKIELEKDVDPLASLDLSIETPIGELERALQNERAALAASTARSENYDRLLVNEDYRTATIRQRLLELSQQQEQVAAQLRAPVDPDESQSIVEARRWLLTTESAALDAESKALSEEAASQGVRRELLEAQSEQESVRSARIDRRLQALSALFNQKKQLDAVQANETAEQARKDIVGSDPLLIELAERNTQLTSRLNVTAARLDELDSDQLLAEKLTARIQADSTDARAAVESSGRSEGLGEVLVAHRSSLPDVRQYIDRAKARKREIDSAVVRNLRHREEVRRAGEIDQTIAYYKTQLASPWSSQLEEQVRDLVVHRDQLLAKALADDELYLDRLRALDAAEQDLIAEITSYKEFLVENLLWLGSVHPTRLSDFNQLPDELRHLLSPSIWLGLSRALIEQIAQAPLAWLVLALVVVLAWKRKSTIASIENISKQVYRSDTDRFSHTLYALALTLIVASPLSIFLAVVGWQLNSIPAESEPMYSAVGVTLMRVSVSLYVLRAVQYICMPRGVASVHFRWRQRSLRVLRSALKHLVRVYIPALLFLRWSMDLNAGDTGGLVTRLIYVVGFGALAVFFFRIFHPTRGVFAHWRVNEKTLIRAAVYWSVYFLFVVTPLALSALPLMGFLYTVLTFSLLYISTMWAALVLLLLHALALRGLRLVESSHGNSAAPEATRRNTAMSENSETSVDLEESREFAVEESELDIDTLSEDIHGLVNIATTVAGLVALYLIWSPILPAFRIFDEVHLWYQTISLNGVETRSPITLGDLILALVYATSFGVIVARLPALMEIILQKRFDVSAGSRYAIVVLTKYVLVVVAILLVASTIGAQWSELQWLVAALSVGIGFGLQEIVANFFSGLIILFEQPVRVGDIVTVGETEGVVTKIRIRATTIRTWDRRELLVPNKELITGRVLNWSLSDEMSRIVVVVGVAYGSDVDTVQALMQEAASENELIVDEPAPFVSFEGFGDNALTFLLRAYIEDLSYRLSTISELHKAINQKFNEAGVVIAFPQRDLHLNTSEPLRINIQDSPPNNSARDEDDDGGR